jgi:hypothetical protein
MTKHSSIRCSDDLEQQLFAAGRHRESPPRGTLERTLEQVELAAAAGLLATAAPTAAAAATAQVGVATNAAGVGGAGLGIKVATTSLTLKSFLSGLAVGVAATSLAGAGVVVEQHWSRQWSANASVLNVRHAAGAPQPTRAGPADLERATELLTPAPDASRDSPRLAAPDTSQQRDALGLDVATAKRAHPIDQTPESRTPATGGPSDAPPSPISPELARELALLDQARAALERRDTAAAVRWLDQHAERFPKGQLAPEATALRGEAAAQLSRKVHGARSNSDE